VLTVLLAVLSKGFLVNKMREFFDEQNVIVDRRTGYISTRLHSHVVADYGRRLRNLLFLTPFKIADSQSFHVKFLSVQVDSSCFSMCWIDKVNICDLSYRTHVVLDKELAILRNYWRFLCPCASHLSIRLKQLLDILFSPAIWHTVHEKICLLSHSWSRNFDRSV